MPDSFFASSKPRKRKRSGQDAGPAAKRISRNKPPPPAKSHTKAKVNGARKRPRNADEEIDSDHTNEEDEGGVENMELRVSTDDGEELSGEEDVDETPAEKRLRLAKLYLESVKEGLADGEFDAAEIDRELVASRLRKDVMEHSGKVHLFVADNYDFTIPPGVLRTRGHRFSVTSAVVSNDARFLFTAGKEGSIIKWDLTNGKKLFTFHKRRPKGSKAIGSVKKNKKRKEKAYAESVDGHIDEVLALAMSGDGKYLASGGRDRKIGIWDVEKEEWVKGFSGHRDTISALSFRIGTQQLYSGSFDRTLKLFDLSVLGYVETLFGHQDPVLSLDALRGETAVSVGGMDKTVRYWKIADETQLVFRGGGRSAVRDVLEGGAVEGLEEDGDDDGNLAKSETRRGQTRNFVEGSIECVAMIDETTFVSGGDSGSICLWTIQRKKPIFKQGLAHGFNDVRSETEGLIQTPRWITAIASLRYSDLFASGSWEGDIRIWKLEPNMKSFTLMGTVPAPGVVNSLQFLTSPKGFTDNATWAAPTGHPLTTEDTISQPEPVGTTRRNASTIRAEPVLLVAGMGQEHRLGRWIKLKGDGIVNGTLVFVFPPRTSITN